MISVDIAGERYSSFGEGVSDSPRYVFTDGLGFCLCEVAHDGYHGFACFCQRVDVLLFEDHTDAECFEFSDVFEAVDSVSCESGDGLDEDEVYLMLSAVLYHLEEFRAFLRHRACDAFVCVDTCVQPVLVFCNDSVVVFDLGFVAVLLFVLLGRYSAVGCDLQEPFYGYACALLRLFRFYLVYYHYVSPSVFTVAPFMKWMAIFPWLFTVRWDTVRSMSSVSTSSSLCLPM